MGVPFCGRGLNSLLNPEVHGGRMLSRARKKVSVLFKPHGTTQNQPRARAFPAASRTSLSAATWMPTVMQGRATGRGSLLAGSSSLVSAWSQKPGQNQAPRVGSGSDAERQFKGQDRHPHGDCAEAAVPKLSTPYFTAYPVCSVRPWSD